MNQKYIWTQHQVLLAINLYYRIPFSVDLREDPSVHWLCSTFNIETGHGVELLVRLQALDPDAPNPEGSPTDVEQNVWKIFHDSLELQTSVSQRVIERLRDDASPRSLPNLFENTEAALREEELDRIRYGQSFLRDVLLVHYKNACAVCDLNQTPYLSPAHIVPWESIENPNLRVDPRNAILLCPLHKKAFELNDLQIDPNSYTVLISENKDMEDRMSSGWRQLRYYHAKKLTMPYRFPPKKQYLRERIQVPDEASTSR